MKPNSSYWAGKRVCVTGGTGFLGWNIVLQLLPRAAHVRIFGLPPASERLRAQLQPLDCVYGDVRDPSAASKALRDCDVVFHTAGTVAMWGSAIQKMHDIHIGGTKQILQALPAGARLVHTSSVVTVGGTDGKTVLTETSPFQPRHIDVDYVWAKRAAEQLALAAAARGQDVVVVNPGYLIGPDDYEGSVMGRFCVRCWKDKIQLIMRGGMSFVDVRDVAIGHLLAAERGDTGCRYILAGENLSYAALVARLLQFRPSARRRFVIPSWILSGFAWLAELRGRWRQREPFPTMQQMRLCHYHWYYSSACAENQLGYRARALDDTLRDTHDWYCREGTLEPLASNTPACESSSQRTAA